MKKVICLLLALVMVLSLAACGKQPADQQPEETSKTPEKETTQTATTEATSAPEETEAAGIVLQVPSKEIYFNCPDGWSYSKETYSTVLMETNASLVAVCYNWVIPYEGDLEGIVAFFSDGVMRDVSPYSQGYLGAASITTTSAEKTKLGNQECVRFIGTVPNTEWNCHVYGYVFVVNDIPMMVMGLVSTQAQDAQMISDINALTDQIAATVRTTK